MRLTDVVELAVRRGVERHVQKRAGVVLPLTIGAMLPGIAHKAIERARSSERMLDEGSDKTAAFGGPGSMQMPPSLGFSLPAAAMGGQAAHGVADSVKSLAGAPLQGVGQGIGGGIAESIKRMMLGREFGERKDPLHMGGTAAIQTFGKGLGEMGVDLLRDIASKAMSAAGHAGDDAARQAILGDLKRTDPVLSNADDKVLMEAYHTMTRFAPVLSTDKNAVRSFLRQAVMSGAGPDYASIKLLADSERAVTGERD